MEMAYICFILFVFGISCLRLIVAFYINFFTNRSNEVGFEWWVLLGLTGLVGYKIVLNGLIFS